VRGVAHLVVGTADTALSLGSGDVPVLGTPRLVALLEKAARSAADGDLPLSATTVGVVMHVEHIAPSPVGVTVTATARVREQTARRIDFDIEARDENGTVIATATHRRVVVDRASFIEKLGRAVAG
jgi:fluoroacetyl-CoA thioesterase